MTPNKIELSSIDEIEQSIKLSFNNSTTLIISDTSIESGMIIFLLSTYPWLVTRSKTPKLSSIDMEGAKVKDVKIYRNIKYIILIN